MKQLIKNKLTDAWWFIKTSKKFVHPNSVIEWVLFYLELPLAFNRYRKLMRKHK